MTPTSLILGIQDYRCEAIIGVHPHERTTPQSLVISLSVQSDKIPQTDDLAQTLSYSGFAGYIQKAAARQPQLLETLAQDILALLFAGEPLVNAAEVEIRKMQAVPGAACAFVKLKAER